MPMQCYPPRSTRNTSKPALDLKVPYNSRFGDPDFGVRLGFAPAASFLFRVFPNDRLVGNYQGG